MFSSLRAGMGTSNIKRRDDSILCDRSRRDVGGQICEVAFEFELVNGLAAYSAIYITVRIDSITVEELSYLYTYVQYTSVHICTYR